MSPVMNKIAWLWLLTWISGLSVYSCLAMDVLDDRRPPEHFCPITMEVMKDPVVASDGHSYERMAIEEYLKVTSRPKSPITGLPLNSQNLFDNQTLKTMIMDWKPGNQAEPSVLETRSASDIAQRVREEFNRNAALLNAAKDRDIVAFLGNTGAGKSTLVNLLAGKEIRVGDDEEDYILVNPHDPTAMVIGTGGSSETLYPKSIDVGNLRFFDLPGFNDTDGSERNLVNAAFIRKILLDAASVRLVFVVGQDQFTADRSASVRQMFNCLNQLFVVEGNTNLVDNGVFVATKVTCAPQAEMTEFLLKKTDSQDKAALNDQLQSWSRKNRLSRMFHPLRDSSNTGIREQILGLIKETKATKIHGINVSALYPSDTKRDLERMFVSVLEGALARKLKEHPGILTEYDRALEYYTSKDFWPSFSANVCEEDAAVGLLKEFCSIPYTKAQTGLEQGNGGKLKGHIQSLRSQRQERVKDIEKRTAQRTQEVILSLVPAKLSDDYVTFDFAYHRDFYDEVCSPKSIVQLATDPIEQEVVRSCYAGLISQHSHDQMMRWHQKFSGIESLRKQLEVTQQKLYALVEEPLIKAREAEEERQKIQAQKVAEVERQRRIEAEEAERIRLSVPIAAQGHEAIYQRFLNGVLIYRPDGKSDNGRINLRISDLVNPLEGTFDLSQCGDTGNYLSISTGYRKVKRPENASKVEIWFAPRFLIERELGTTAGHFKPIIDNWKQDVAPVGMFWTWGDWDDLGWYDYLTTENMENLSKIDLYENWKKSDGSLVRCLLPMPTRGPAVSDCPCGGLRPLGRSDTACFVCELK